MLIQIGFVICLLSIVAGYWLEGGNLIVLLHPYAALIIIGAAVGILLISNPRSTLVAIYNSLPKLARGQSFKKEDYTQVITFLFFFFSYVRKKSIVEIEETIEDPTHSKIFKDFPIIINNVEILTFLCDYTRMLVLGYENNFELDNMMENQIYIRKIHTNEVSGAIYKLGEALPALGIVAAVLGMINVMASFNKSPHVIGEKIATALLGTLIGVAAAYCVVNPIAAYLEKFGMDEAKALECIKAGFMAHARGNPPVIAIEFARQAVPINVKPTFQEVEKAIELKKKQYKKQHGR